MRWCFTRFRHRPHGTGWPKMRWCFTRFGVRASVARAYAARRVRDSLLSFLVLDQDIVAAHVRGVFLRADATRCGWVARGVVAFFALYILKYILHRSPVNRRNGASGEVAQNALVLH